MGAGEGYSSLKGSAHCTFKMFNNRMGCKICHFEAAHEEPNNEKK
jgi:hypothetical protein